MTVFDSLRLFIAVDTPEIVKHQMALLTGELSHRWRNVRWEAPGKFHCTLCFLGNVRRALLPSIERRVAHAAAGTPPLSLAYSGIGFFPDATRPRVIWIGIQDVTGELLRLQQRVSGSLAEEGFAPEERAFHPHVTVGRVQATQRSGALIEIAETRTFYHPPVPVPAVEIMQSITGPRGSTYVVLHSIMLSGTPGDAAGAGAPQLS
jgi:2'-5' RNA ligase